eukprot:3874503-Pyramimonas_sp.AAC.1
MPWGSVGGLARGLWGRFSSGGEAAFFCLFVLSLVLAFVFDIRQRDAGQLNMQAELTRGPSR